MDKQTTLQIQTLCKYDSRQIAVLFPNTLQQEFYVYTYFDPPSRSSSTSIEFVALTGINITEFITTNRYDAHNVKLYINSFNEWLKPLVSLQLKFNKTIDYILITS